MVAATKKPSALRAGDKANFQTILKAAENRDLALVSAVRKSDNQRVALVCAMDRKNGMIVPIPLAVMVEGNPFEDFYDPTV